ncbi:hypothetical protein [Streptomyces sp. NPDC056144]|uniref:hypothetical protein n=1 Tax=unclassified Streptomyces TaxID=2593676 RepID=UPI0035DFC464
MPLHTGWLAPEGQTRHATRHVVVGATTPVGPLHARSGILPGTYDGKYRVGGLWMSGNGPMTATVYHGRAVVQGPITQGAYPVTLEGDTVITFADGDAQYDRIDLVVLRVYDTQYDGSQRTEAAIEIVKGTAAATPVAPDVPPLSLALFTVRVKAGTSAGSGGIQWASGVITDLRVTTAGVGGILPVYNNAAVPGSYPGQYQDNDNSHFLQRWDGTAWVAYPKEVGGIAPTGTISVGSYTGQFRESSGTLQRWNGTAWDTYRPPRDIEALSSGALVGTGWTLASFAARRTRDGVVSFRASVTRTGGDIVASSVGGTSDYHLITLPTGWWPAINIDVTASDTMASGAATVAYYGTVTLRDWSPTATIPNGRVLSVSGTYVQ